MARRIGCGRPIRWYCSDSQFAFAVKRKRRNFRGSMHVIFRNSATRHFVIAGWGRQRLALIFPMRASTEDALSAATTHFDARRRGTCIIANWRFLRRAVFPRSTAARCGVLPR